MARSIGDHHAATVGVIAEPEITEYELTDDDVALVIASDGVWELLSSQSVADIVASVKSLDPAEICKQIIDQACSAGSTVPLVCTLSDWASVNWAWGLGGGRVVLLSGSPARPAVGSPPTCGRSKRGITVTTSPWSS